MTFASIDYYSEGYVEEAAYHYEESSKQLLSAQYNVGATLQKSLNNIGTAPQNLRHDYINKILRDTLEENSGLIGLS